MSEIRIRLAIILFIAQIFGAAGAYAQSQLTPGSFKAYAPESLEPRMSDFSGKPVPRYASLRHDKVNGRAGPSLDYPIRWTYERAGLPVVIVRESQDWRKIRDPMGDEVWVNKSQLAAERTAITTSAGAVFRDANPRSPHVAQFEAGAVVSLGECAGIWCKVEAEGREGWIRQALLWGIDPLTTIPGNH
ncbi:MAG: SH3 domain-containing protein [Hyphomonadaceae bacterium]